MFPNATLLKPLQSYYGADQYKEPTASNIITRMKRTKDVLPNGQRLPKVNLNEIGGRNLIPQRVIAEPLSSLPPNRLQEIVGIARLSEEMMTDIANFRYAETLKQQNPADRNLPDEMIQDPNELTKRYLQRKLQDNKAKDLDILKQHSEMIGHDIPEDELQRQLERADIQRLISDPKYKAQVMETLREDGFSKQAKKIQDALATDFDLGRKTQDKMRKEMKSVKGLFEQMIKSQEQMLQEQRQARPEGTTTGNAGGTIIENVVDHETGTITQRQRETRIRPEEGVGEGSGGSTGEGGGQTLGTVERSANRLRKEAMDVTNQSRGIKAHDKLAALAEATIPGYSSIAKSGPNKGKKKKPNTLYQELKTYIRGRKK